MGVFFHAGNENFPHAAPKQLAHRMDATIPDIEIAHHAYSPRIRRPNRKINAALATDLAQMRAELFIESFVRSLCEKMQIDLAHDRAVAVGIAQELLRAVERDHFHQIREV